jgi:gliding motility-associated-like protein
VSVTAKSDSTTVTASRVITVSRSAIAAFNASLSESGYPNALHLTNYSSGHLSSYWKFNDAGIDTNANTVKYYSKSGSYTVTLFALGRNGCNDSSSYAFRISDSSSIVLPNVFTPNNDDINDVFKPITTGINKLNLYISNRDGTIVSSWDKVNGFWDGHTTSGERCSTGVYYVVLQAEGFDGKLYKMKGSLTLLR